MALQNFVDRVGPVISSAWLNVVDSLKFSVFADATTKTAARTALTSDAPLEVANGGTGARTLGAIQLTPAQILSSLLGVDGAGSGLDADLLDGHSTTYFATASALAATDATVASHTHTAGSTVRKVSGTTDSPTAADAEHIVTLSSGSATVITLNLGVCAVGQSIAFMRLGAGSNTFAPGTSQTINSPGARLVIPEQYGTVVATYRANNTWILGGV